MKPPHPYTDFDTHYQKLFSLLKTSHLPQAFELLTHLKSHHPHQLVLYEIMSEVCYELGWYEMGKNNIAYLIHHLSHPSDEMYLLYLKHLDALHEYEEILTLCQTVLKQNDDPHIKFYHYCGLAFEKLNQASQALLCYQQAYEVNPTHPVTLSFYTRLLYQEHRYMEAYDRFHEALACKVCDDQMWYFHGHCCQILNRFKESQQAYKKAFKLNPHFGSAYFFYALSFKKTAPKKAIKYLKKSLYGDPPQFKAYRHLGDLYCDLNRLSQAYEMYSLALFYASSNTSEVDKIKQKLDLLSRVQSSS